MPSGAIQAYLVKTFGGPISEKDTLLQPGAGVTRLVKNDPDRVALTVINLGSGPIYVALDQQADNTRGIYLSANGGTLSMNCTTDMSLPGREWWFYTAGATNNVYVLETRVYSHAGG